MLNKIKLIGISSLVADSRQADSLTTRAVEPNRSLNRTGIPLSLAALSPLSSAARHTSMDGTGNYQDM